MKRLIALMLVFMLAISVVAVGCAKKEEPKKPEVTAPAPPPAQPPAQQPAPPAEQKPAEAPKAPEKPAEKK